MVSGARADIAANILNDLMADISQGSRKNIFYMMLETHHSSNAYKDGRRLRKISKTIQ